MNEMDTPPAAMVPAPAIDRAALTFSVRKLLRCRNRAALATSFASGGDAPRPYVSLVTTATDIDGSPLLLLSKLADHTRNLERDSRLSLLFEDTEIYANPQQGPRVTVIGTARRCEDQAIIERVRRRFLARHPGAALYAGFADFSFFKIALERFHWVGGFGRAVWLNQDLPCSGEAVTEFAAVESDLIGRINRDHAEALMHAANSLTGKRAKHWRAVSLDPDGIDAKCSQRVYRLGFPKSLISSGELIPTLSNLAVLGKNGVNR
ncbi:MAG TPA: pyridoxamine 5'-phosphate oxidase family protein [Candidatus Sulfotelmatobacter sp.]|jgi:putative heme iron utilization protein|nr:pyridoxamine 5'-phosphate oxidase family protein [Candidatus Sulfotelmatobacter sp.]